MSPANLASSAGAYPNNVRLGTYARNRRCGALASPHAHRLATVTTSHDRLRTCVGCAKKNEHACIRSLGTSLADPAGTVDGTQVTEDELRDALDALHARE